MYMYMRVYLTLEVFFFLTIDERSVITTRCRALLNAVIKGHSCCSYFYRCMYIRMYARTRVGIYIYIDFRGYIYYIFIEVEDINVLCIILNRFTYNT